MKQALTGHIKLRFAGQAPEREYDWPWCRGGDFTGLLVPVDDGLDGVAEQARRRKRGVQKEDPVLLSYVGQGQPQMPLRCHQGCHRPPNSMGCPLGGTESQISGSPELRDVIGAHRLTLIQLFKQVSLVCLQHRHSVQARTSLTRCRIPLAHQH